jgi:hypothetical protein
MRLGGDTSGALLYAPITFCGQTNLTPSLPREGSVPADAEVLGLYHRALVEDQGHHLDPARLVAEVRAHGGTLLAQGASNWVIPAPEDGAGDAERRMWDTMHYFFAIGTAGAAARAELEGSAAVDLAQWSHRARAQRGTIEVANVDLLFLLAGADSEPATLVAEPASEPTAARAAGTQGAEVLEFSAPRTVAVRAQSEVEAKLGATDLRLRTLSSAVSPGTELKIFRGAPPDWRQQWLPRRRDLIAAWSVQETLAPKSRSTQRSKGCGTRRCGSRSPTGIRSSAPSSRLPLHWSHSQPSPVD